jgi:hypothetical protein
MGYIKHEVVVAILDDHYGKDQIADIEALREEMKRPHHSEIEGDCSDRILGPCNGVNGYTTYVFAPDGSKECWSHSDIMDSYRDRFKAIVKSARFPEMIHIQFAGDDHQTIILETTDEEPDK